MQYFSITILPHLETCLLEQAVDQQCPSFYQLDLIHINVDHLNRLLPHSGKKTKTLHTP